MKVSVLMPYASAGPDRDRAAEWLWGRWGCCFPDWELLLGSPDEVGDPGRFNRPLAINRAAARASGDVYVIADADTAFHPADVLAAAQSGSYVLPGRYVRLDQPTTDRWLRDLPDSDAPPGWHAGIEEEWPANVSGIVVLPREAFEAAGGFDERFKGWGWDDGAFHAAVETMWGHAVRPPSDVNVAWHLWHPRPREHSVWGPWAAEQRQLGQRFIDAAGDKATMAALLAESR